MKPTKMTREELEYIRGYEPSKITLSYEEYEERFEESIAEYNARSITLAELDKIIASKLLKETM